MASKTEKDIMRVYRDGIIDAVRRWKDIRDHGCNDPFWPDGCNMNLCRNHAIYYKTKIEELHAEIGVPFPEEYYIPTPPEVSNRHMSNLKQKERVQRLAFDGSPLTTGKIKYDEAQLSFI